MSDFFSKGSEKIDLSNADLVESGSEKRHHDTRFDKKTISVTSAENVKEYKIKQWPTIGDFDDYADSKNAIGMSIDMLYKRRKAIENQIQNQIFEYESEQMSAAIAAIEEDFASSEPETIQGVSLEELDKIRADAYEEGKKQGYDDGYQEGLAKGSEEGKEQGFQAGLEEGGKKGYEDGLVQGQEDGFVKGHNEGLEAGQKIVLEQAERFRFLADSLANPLREIDRDVTDEIAYIISRLVKVITHREIKNNSEFLTKSVEKAVSILPNAKQGAEVHLNPEDYAVIAASIGQDYIRQQNWQLVEDETLQLGDIRVTNSVSEVNWRINDRIDSVLEEFLSTVYPSVDSALRESIPGCPEYDEVPKKPLAPRSLSDLAGQTQVLEDIQIEAEQNAQPQEQIMEAQAAQADGEIMANDPDAQV